ncbi:hypothetical protein ICE98_02855 [Lactococcus lactis]|nr:hypothetical protein [Lactococcus lactis]
MNKTFEKEEILNELYNLILDRNIRDWERQCLLHTKVQLENQGQLADELAKLEATLSPWHYAIILHQRSLNFIKKFPTANSLVEELVEFCELFSSPYALKA